MWDMTADGARRGRRGFFDTSLLATDDGAVDDPALNFLDEEDIDAA